jgi:hypothetical protein
MILIPIQIVTAAALAGCGTLAVQYFKKDHADDESGRQLPCHHINQLRFMSGTTSSYLLLDQLLLARERRT